MKNTIHVHRAIHKMTQADLSEAIGVSRQTINSIEKSRYVPSTILALKIARTFKVTVEELFELEDSDDR
ncbi:helix-turn-helix transcriptional regulator [Nonlabens sp.]|uniref:helix-turn-helix transcriptional regulator n=1 Tax=Nonlabens sp. TaxID=1888209 RepID=UPI00326493AB